MALCSAAACSCAGSALPHTRPAPQSRVVTVRGSCMPHSSCLARCLPLCAARGRHVGIPIYCLVHCLDGALNPAAAAGGQPPHQQVGQSTAPGPAGRWWDPPLLTPAHTSQGVDPGQCWLEAADQAPVGDPADPSRLLGKVAAGHTSLTQAGRFAVLVRGAKGFPSNLRLPGARLAGRWMRYPPCVPLPHRST